MHSREPGNARPVTTEAPHAELAGAAGSLGSAHTFVGQSSAEPSNGGTASRAGGCAPGARASGSPKPIPVTVWRRVDADLATAYNYVVPIDLTTIFRGYGPLPAVTGTRGERGTWGTAAGQQRTVLLADGGQVEETVLEAHAPGLFRYEVLPTRGMLRLIVRRIEGRFVFSPSEAGGTVIRWTYVFRPRRGAHLLARLIAPLWRRYAQQVMERIAKQLRLAGAPEPKQPTVSD